MINNSINHCFNLAARDSRRFFFKLSVLLIVCLQCYAIALPASAHEFWIEPESFRPQAGVPFDVRVLVGQDFNGDGVIFLPETFERFETVTARGKQKVNGTPGDDPAGHITPTETGSLLVAYQSTRFSLSMDAKTFEGYLKKEGLEDIRILRSNAGKSGKPANEVYTRFAKSLLAVGGQSNGLDSSRPLGLRFEIVPLTPVYRKTGGQPGEMEVQLLYENQPLANVQIEAFSKKNMTTRLLQRTDQVGRARFTLPHGGVWLLNAVHMIPAPSSANAEWESFWASFTFQW